ncbi:LysR family transcriptional regulator [Cupriavidus sp. L7L]|uniref:LysR substrate-binding domain-containing protein n=1 Tax=Cupriavidus sp. L7L TaxID=2546443 RepID=UPI001FB73AF6|nr:LysR family transcriptional regulator [Cupriavidus sp. L7L]
MNIEIRDLHCFVVVAEEESFSKAAIRLNVAQPALSLRIKELEQKLGTRLFDRTTRSVRLTNAGQVFYSEVKSILLNLSQAVLATQSASRGESGILRIGYTKRASFFLLPAMLRRLSADLPSLRLEIRDPLTTGELYTLVRNRALDLALTYLREERDQLLQHEQLTESELVLVLPSVHPLSSSKVVDLKHLAGEQFVGYPALGGYYLRSVMDNICLDAGFRPSVIQESADTHALLYFVATGRYVSILPLEVKDLQVEGVIFRRIKTSRVIARHGVIWLKNNNNPSLPLALSMLHELASRKK